MRELTIGLAYPGLAGIFIAAVAAAAVIGLGNWTRTQLVKAIGLPFIGYLLVVLLSALLRTWITTRRLIRSTDKALIPN